MSRKDILWIITTLLMVALILLVLCSTAHAQAKPDTTATVNLSKLQERIKYFQDRITEIDKQRESLLTEKYQLQGAIAGMQIAVTDSTLTQKKGSHK
jgi:septal ring factor EnvC (AmiA/AmiB activator)